MNAMPGLEYAHESYPVWLYDMEISNVEERREKRVLFKTAVAAANTLGITPQKMYEKIKTGQYAYHRETNHKYAVRKAKPSELKVA